MATGLANAEAALRGLAPVATQQLILQWIKFATNVFNLGGIDRNAYDDSSRQAYGTQADFLLSAAALQKSAAGVKELTDIIGV